jgi:phosphoribosylformylglycinamidine synthase
MMQSVIEFAQNGGKVFGVCNGFQVLCESGLLPGVLLQNEKMKFACKNTFIKNSNTGEILKIPVAHGEGRFFAKEDELEDIQKNDQIIYSYCDEKGEIHIDHSPNGSILSIAGISNKERNVFGMMPHPERACSGLLGNTDGKKVFKELFSIN